MTIASIHDFRQVRADGRVIEPGMTIHQMIELGWGPSKVVRLEWSCEGNPVAVIEESGLLPEVLPDGSGVALIVGGRAKILNADGSLRLEIPQQLSGGGRTYIGDFGWFETPESESEVSLVLMTALGDFRFGIHASSGAVLSCNWTK